MNTRTDKYAKKREDLSIDRLQMIKDSFIKNNKKDLILIGAILITILILITLLALTTIQKNILI